MKKIIISDGNDELTIVNCISDSDFSYILFSRSIHVDGEDQLPRVVDFSGLMSLLSSFISSSLG